MAKVNSAIANLLDSVQSHPTQNEKDKHITTEKAKHKIDYDTKKLPTSDCVIWSMANRLEQFINQDSCKDLIESIQAVGQKIPAIARYNDSNKNYEIICGARRYFACKKLKIPLLTAVVNLSDQDALLVMDAENRPRKDITAYERALDYKKWIENDYYSTYTEIAKSIGMKKSWFTQLMSLADLPPEVVSVFKHPTNLKQTWGYKLARACVDPVVKTKLINLSKQLLSQEQPPSPPQAYQLLMSEIESNTLAPKSRIYADNNKIKVVKDSKKKTMITIKQDINDSEIKRIINLIEEVT